MTSASDAMSQPRCNLPTPIVDKAPMHWLQCVKGSRLKATQIPKPSTSQAFHPDPRPQVGPCGHEVQPRMAPQQWPPGMHGFRTRKFQYSAFLEASEARSVFQKAPMQGLQQACFACTEMARRRGLSLPELRLRQRGGWPTHTKTKGPRAERVATARGLPSQPDLPTIPGAPRRTSHKVPIAGAISRECGNEPAAGFP